MDSIGYSRVSQPHQDLEGQENRVTSLALRNGYNDPLMFGGVAQRFSPIEQRPEGKELIRCLHTTRHPLCLESVDRIGGTEQVIRFAKDHVRETGHKLYTSKEQGRMKDANHEVDLKNFDRFVTMVKEERIEEHYDDTVNKTKAGKKKWLEAIARLKARDIELRNELAQAQSEGNTQQVNVLSDELEWVRVQLDREREKLDKLLWERPPFGIQWNEVKREFIETDAACHVTSMFNWVAYHGYSQEDVRQELREQGVRTQRDKEWSKSSVNYVLTNRVYVTGMKPSLHEDGFYTAPILVDPYTWERVQARLSWLDKNKGRLKAGNKGLAGRVYCRRCSRVMGVKKSTLSCPTCKLCISVDAVRQWALEETMRQLRKIGFSIDDMVKFRERIADMEKIKRMDMKEQERLLWNWSPIELGHRILLGENECIVNGLSEAELKRVLE